MTSRRAAWGAGWAGLALALLGACAPPHDGAPVLLTFDGEETAGRVSVRWLTPDSVTRGFVHFDREPRGGDPAAYAQRAEGRARALPGLGRSVQRVPLDGLAPDTPYWFVAGDPEGGYGAERSFRTPPAPGAPLRFVAGGDVSTGLLPRLLSSRAAEQRPSFALLGGDLAYAERGAAGLARWERWLADWDGAMRTPEGHLVPVLAAPGNHDVDPQAPPERPLERGGVFLGLLGSAEGERSYFLRRFGGVGVWVLDSGILAPHGGAQREWLERSLAAASALDVRFAVYHVGLYPAFHPFDEGRARDGRREWAPLFDAFGFAAAFESHGHLLKRTHPLRHGQASQDGAGTLYLGDGAWGKSRLMQPARDRAYLAMAAPRRHVWRVDVGPDAIRYTALGGAGQVLDTVVQERRGALWAARP